MKLPTSVRIGRTQYTVQMKPMMLDKLGHISYKTNTIRIATHDVLGRRRRARDVSETFWHELTHGILHDMGPKWSALRDDEAFVIAFSRRLNAAIYSATL